MSIRRCLSVLTLFSHLYPNRHGTCIRHPLTVGKPVFTRTFHGGQAALERGSVVKTVFQEKKLFLDAAERRDPRAIASQYLKYRQALQAIPEGNLPPGLKALRLQSVIDGIEALASAPSISDARFLPIFLAHCKKYHGVAVGKEVLSRILSALVSSGRSNLARDMLEAYEEAKDVKIHPGHWCLVMKGLVDSGEFIIVKDCMEHVRYFTVEHHQRLLESLLRHNSPSAAEMVSEIFNVMQEVGVVYNEKIFRMLELHGRREGFLFSNTAQEYVQRFPCPTGRVNARSVSILQKARNSGRHQFVVAFRHLLDQGFKPDERTLVQLMVSVSTVDELKFLESTLGVKASLFAWSRLINNVLSKRTLDDALETYEIAKTSGITPDSAMVHPLLRRICNPPLLQPTESALDRALSIYRDLQQSKSATNSTVGLVAGDPDLRQTADTAVYNTLLRALASTSMKTKFFPIALSLLRDMNRHDINMDSMTAASIGVLLIRSSSSFSEATRAYRHVHSLRHNIFDAKAYTAVLHAYCSLKFDGGSEQQSSYPPPSGYFEIVRDMEQRGIARSPQIYTILLGRYAAVAERVRSIRDRRERENTRQAVEAVLRKTHDHLTVDASVTPDAPLYNQLMDAYNRVASFDNVLNVWNLLSAGGLHNNASVSVVLDACGFAGRYSTADSIFSSLKQSKFPLNSRNWNAWVECLCRVNRVEEAVQTVCLEMPHLPVELHPNETTIRILMSFAIATNQQAEVLSRLQRYVPELCSRLPKDVFQ